MFSIRFKCSTKSPADPQKRSEYDPQDGTKSDTLAISSKAPAPGDEEIEASLWPGREKKEDRHPLETQDYVRLGAELLIRQLAIEHTVATKPAALFKSTDILIIEVPPMWVSAVAHSQLKILFSDQSVYFDHVETSQVIDEDHSAVTVLRRLDIDAEVRSEGFIDRLISSIRSRKPVVIITDDAKRSMPAAVLNTADQVLSLPAPSNDWLRTVIKAATGDGSYLEFPEIDFSELRPELLQLAWREGQTAADYLQRLLRAIKTDITTDENTRTNRPKSTEENQNSSSHPPIPTLEDLHGMPELVQWAQALAIDVNEYKEGKLRWEDVDRGAILFGPPGTGKTTSARAVADHVKIPYLPTSYAEWQSNGEGHLGDVVRSMRQTFDKARKLAPCILLIDEIDSLSSRENSTYHAEWWRSIINALLELLDGSADRAGVIVLGATNHLSTVDPAIRRAGRMDREIEIRLPDSDARQNIFRFYLGGVFDQADLQRLAAISVGRTGADIARFARGARRRARAERRTIKFEDIYIEIAGELVDQNDVVMQRIAVHEAGHAVLLALQYPGSPPLVQIKNDGKMSGGTTYRAKEHALLTALALNDLLIVLMAGRAAEELIVGEVSAGAGGPPQSDLARATYLSVLAEAGFGFGANGLVWADVSDHAKASHLLALRPDISNAVRMRLDEAYSDAKRIIGLNRTAVILIAQAALEKNILLPDEVASLMRRAQEMKSPA